MAGFRRASASRSQIKFAILAFMQSLKRQCPIYKRTCEQSCFIVDNLEAQAATGGGQVMPFDAAAGPLWETGAWQSMCDRYETQATDGHCPERAEVLATIARLTLQKLRDGTLL